ncbi:peptidylprolyl isomerase [Rhodoplanes sp. Z2-YC6860]|uniref:peptidylprolyl isomerase n=1 Tax=Rhodoplanes sp. Z2-YC6860 TaxID=674703 RepID=UPI00078D4B0C|nr:peptidylprolyl isomerase [Rhodoplanes sp. Z2-YC6860]AMN41531.1 PpiC-type peptidyl-prolyl cis-trans isomerase [Rhodoplanes sp. Z2-YC6860]
MTLVIDNTGNSGPPKPAAVRPAPSAPPLVSVNGVVISRDAIAREIQNHPADKPLAAWQSAARALVVRELLLQEARRLRIAAEPETDETGRRETDEEALLRALAEQEITTPEPDEEVCRRYFERNLARFRSADIYEAAHILFSARHDDPAAFAEAQRQGELVLAELQREPGRFAELAEVHSACPSGAQGGNLGQISTGQTTPEFERALVALQPGELCQSLVPTRYGLHIVRLDRCIEGRQLPFEMVFERVADYLREGVTRRATAQYIARLVSRAEIKGVEIEGAEAHRVN